MVDSPEDADATVGPQWVFGALVVDSGFCGHPDANVGRIPRFVESESSCTDYSYDDGKQHWRGGKRGRKGKIKYERR